MDDDRPLIASYSEMSRRRALGWMAAAIHVVFGGWVSEKLISGPLSLKVAPKDFRRGVAMSSLQGAPGALPGHLNGEVFIIPEAHFAYYAEKGFDHVRLEGTWERLQPRLMGALGEQLLDHYSDPDNPWRDPVKLVRSYLDMAGKHGLKVILDLCHNYGERHIGYDGSWEKKAKAQLGSEEVPLTAFADYCVKLMLAFGDHPALAAIELMNEPHDLAVGEAGWREACQLAITSIRSLNREIPIIINGYGWASAEYWPERNPSLHTLVDPSDKLIWSAHQYFDANSSGTYGGGGEAAPADVELGVKRLAPFIAWLAEHGFSGRGHLGEFGAPDRAEWRGVVQNGLASASAAGLRLTAHQDVPYENDPYPMNLFPPTDSSGKIAGPDRLFIQAMRQLPAHD